MSRKFGVYKTDLEHEGERDNSWRLANTISLSFLLITLNFTIVFSKPFQFARNVLLAKSDRNLTQYYHN